MASTLSFIVTAWEPDGAPARRLVESIVSQGVDRKRIHIVDDRISRPISLNRALMRCDTDYVGLCESDVIPSTNAVATLTRLLDRHPQVGLAAAKVHQVDELPLAPPIPLRDPDASDGAALDDISGQMWTLNFVVYRRSTQILFDEDYFGNQIFDWDFGLELHHGGYLSMSDARCAVVHQRSDYVGKNIAYHACVARNRQILGLKWQNRVLWQGVKPFQRAHRGVIPTVEELTHANEEWLFKYIARFESGGLSEAYFKPRFGDAAQTASYLEKMTPLLTPQIWETPVLTVALPTKPASLLVETERKREAGIEHALEAEIDAGLNVDAAIFRVRE